MLQDSGELAAAISSVSAPSNPTLGKVPGLSEKGFVCPETGNFVDELEINDYPQVARYKLTQKVCCIQGCDSRSVIAMCLRMSQLAGVVVV